MRHRLTLTAVVIAAVAGAPQLATAQCTVDSVIDGCDRAFPRSSFFAEPLRGWCYIFGIANCAVS